MPELPEVENVKLGLEELGIPGQTFRSVELLRENLRTPLSAELTARLPGRTILSIRRRAKFLLFETEDDVIISHLGMTGSWRTAGEAAEAARKHDHVRWVFASGLNLIFNDPRRFGILEIAPRAEVESTTWLKNLAPEPLGDDFTPEYLLGITRGRTAPIKAILMDQRYVVGVGNIYASEVLHRAAVRPGRAAGRVTRAEAHLLVDTIKVVLAEAIAAGGSTIKDYRNSHGDAGSFQERFRVYGRTDLPCVACGTKIRARVVGGRSTYWCSKCQPR
jgi:formamidopyrimidine-DNA glycosylase